MTRVGISPVRAKPIQSEPATLTVGIPVFIPNLEGYYANALDTLSLSLMSLIKNTSVPHDLILFDNGSCIELRHWLNCQWPRQAFVVRSRTNIGKLNALQIMSTMARTPWIAFADCDTLFYPGWAEKEIETAQSFPNIGMVGGWIHRLVMQRFNEATLDMANKFPDIKVVRGQFLPEELEREWAVSVARDVQSHLFMVKALEDVHLERTFKDAEGVERTVQAWAGTSHSQFLGFTPIVRKVLNEMKSEQAMGEMDELDWQFDKAGLLRLTTMRRVTRHIGTHVEPDVADLAKSWGIHTEPHYYRKAHDRNQLGLLRLRPLYWVASKLYHKLFQWLSG